MLTTCPHCGALSARPGARFCGKCGKAISPPSADVANGVCAKGHPQIRSNAHFCYVCGAPVSPLQSQPQPVPPGPTFNGRYQVIGEVGRGGMGSIVYKAQDLQTPGWVLALKEMDAAQLPPSDRQDIVEAFLREAELLYQIDHPNIVKVYDYFQIGDKHYMAMDLIQGKPLDKLLEKSPGGFPEARVLLWAEQLCDALGYLHGQTPPIIYRDMKPGNVMVEGGTDQIKMIDFGIAREFKGGKKKSDTIKFGTDGYAPPEQYGSKGKETSPASDVYALGAMLYQLMTGDDPGSSPFKFYNRARLIRPPVSASQPVADALERAVEVDMDKRFQSMAEFKAALTGQAVSASAPKPQPQKKSAGASSQASSPGSVSTYSPSIPVPSRSVLPLQVSTAQLDLGCVEKGGLPPSPQSFTVTLTGSGLAQVRTSEGWLVAIPSSVGNGQSVEVSVRTELLTLGNKTWMPPNIFVTLLASVALFLSKAWPLVVGALFMGIWWRWIWQGMALILGGALGLQFAMRLVSWLLPRLVVFKAAHTGNVTVTAGLTKTVRVQVTSVPSIWRRVVGWGALILAVATEVVVAAAALLWLVVWLGGAAG